MPELKKLNIEYEEFDIDFNSIAFKDKQREASRLVKLNAPKQTRKPAPTVAWSKKKELKEKRVKRREKKENKRMAIERQNQLKQNKIKEKEAEWAELQEEMREMKRTKL